MNDKTQSGHGMVRAGRRRVLVLALALALGVTFVNVAGPLAPAQGVLTAAVGGARVAWASPSADDTTAAAIQAVIQRANDAQRAAFAAHDPAAMKDTATSAYYAEMAQTNTDLARGGVTAIKLLRLEWGPVTLTDASTATATTYETWRTTYADGTTDVSRDPNVYTLVLDGGAWKIQQDQHGTSAPAPGSQAPTAPSGQAPSPRVNPANTDVSHNWSGYAATGGGFTSVTGTWTVPQSDGTVRFGSAASWVGIGGITSADLIQAGTMETSLGNGSVQYQAWIETLPQASRRAPFTVSPGDSVTVSISESQTGQWLIAFTNNTTGETYQTTVRYTSSHSSAEWVEEAPSTGRRIVPLDNFGAVTFSAGSAVKDGQTQTIAQAGGQPITLVNIYNQALVTPSALTPEGAGFTVTRNASVATPTAPSFGRQPGQGGSRGRSGQPRSPLGGN